MKVNGVDMEEACEEAFEKHHREVYGQSEFAKDNIFQKANKKALFKEGFSAALNAVLKSSQKDKE